MEKLNDQKNKLVTLGFIYALKNPDTSEIFYIGATESSPKDRLNNHYKHFKEYLEGKRGKNKRFEYFESIFPKLSEIEILEIVQNDYLYKKEIEYISKYNNLTNQTIGGEGGDTFSLQDNVNKMNISKLISEKNSKIKRSNKFKNNLSNKLSGKNNPMAGSGSMPKCIMFDENNIPIKLFNAPFEITEFFDNTFGKNNHKKHAGRVGNISKALKKTGKTSSFNYVFINYKQCNKEIQDIVQTR